VILLLNSRFMSWRSPCRWDGAGFANRGFPNPQMQSTPRREYSPIHPQYRSPASADRIHNVRPLYPREKFYSDRPVRRNCTQNRQSFGNRRSYFSEQMGATNPFEDLERDFHEYEEHLVGEAERLDKRIRTPLLLVIQSQKKKLCQSIPEGTGLDYRETMRDILLLSHVSSNGVSTKNSSTSTMNMVNLSNLDTVKPANTKTCNLLPPSAFEREITGDITGHSNPTSDRQSPMTPSMFDPSTQQATVTSPPLIGNNLPDTNAVLCPVAVDVTR
jgi:hypothetical protein